jgi:hypothetical protein
MNDRFDEARRPSRRASEREERQTASASAFEQRQREFERQQHEQQDREALLRQQHGAELAKSIDWAAEITGRQDEEIKAIALDLLIENIAERKVQPPQLPSRDLNDLCQQSIDQAEEWQWRQHQLEREAAHQEPRPDEQAPRQYDLRSHHYGELQETHLKVGEELNRANADPVDEPREPGGEVGASPGHPRRYAALEEMHGRSRVERAQRDESTERQTAELEQTVRGGATRSGGDQVELSREQSDSRRETDDKAQRRQALMQQFGRSIEETFQRELTQDGGQGRG